MAVATRAAAKKARTGWKTEQSPEGWLTMVRAASGCAAHEHLTAHADWDGPTKLIHTPGGLRQRIDVYLGSHLLTEHDPLVDQRAAAELEDLLAEVRRRAGEFSKHRVNLDGWRPPEAKTLSDWLVEHGHTAAIDNDGDLRLAVHRPGCDGQIRVECQPRRLRFTMPLGSWPELAPAAEAAMQQLAAEANAGTRLVRIAWRSGQAGQRCEAQVDLTGLVSRDRSTRCYQRMSRSMVQMAVDGLELALRRLGRELPILADPNYRELAELMFIDHPKRSKRR